VQEAPALQHVVRESGSPLQAVGTVAAEAPLGSMRGTITSPSQAMNARSTTLRSSRTLPGQLWDMSTLRVASSTPETRLSYLPLNSSMKPVTSSGMSSIRCRSGGTVSVNTFRR